MKLKVNYNKKAVSRIEIYLPTGIIKKGDVFNLKDAYVEDGNVVVGVDTDYGVMEASFKIPKSMRIKSKQDVRDVVSSFFFPYLKNATYIF